MLRSITLSYKSPNRKYEIGKFYTYIMSPESFKNYSN